MLEDRPKFKKGDILLDHDGNPYLFSCWSLVIGYCLVTDINEEPVLMSWDKLKKIG